MVGLHPACSILTVIMASDESGDPSHQYSSPGESVIDDGFRGGVPLQRPPGGISIGLFWKIAVLTAFTFSVTTARVEHDSGDSAQQNPAPVISTSKVKPVAPFAPKKWNRAKLLMSDSPKQFLEAYPVLLDLWEDKHPKVPIRELCSLLTIASYLRADSCGDSTYAEFLTDCRNCADSVCGLCDSLVGLLAVRIVENMDADSAALLTDAIRGRCTKSPRLAFIGTALRLLKECMDMETFNASAFNVDMGDLDTHAKTCLSETREGRDMVTDIVEAIADRLLKKRKSASLEAAIHLIEESLGSGIVRDRVCAKLVRAYSSMVWLASDTAGACRQVRSMAASSIPCDDARDSLRRWQDTCASWHRDQGVIAWQFGQSPKEVADAINGALEYSPNDAQLHFISGIADIEKGVVDTVDLKRAIELVTNGQCSLRYSGFLHYARGDADSAVQCFERCIIADGNDYEAYYGMGLAMIAQARDQTAELYYPVGMTYYDSSVNCLESAFEAFRRQPPWSGMPPAELEQSRFARQLQNAKTERDSERARSEIVSRNNSLSTFDHQTSEEDLKDILERLRSLDAEVGGRPMEKRDNLVLAKIRFSTGRAHWFIGDTSEAGVLFKQAVDLDPNYASGWVCLGNFARWEERFDSCISNLKKAFELGATDSIAYYILASCYYRNGDYAEAEKYIRGAGTSPEAKELNDEIRKALSSESNSSR